LVPDASYDPDEQQPLFIDLIIKITIIRAYANLQNKKLLTAEKLLEFAKLMITLLDKSEDIEIQDDLVEREYADIIPLDVLKQKYLLNSGILFIALNQDKTACRHFTDCLKTGEIYDPRIRRDCVIQLQEIFEKQNQHSLSLKLLYKSFKHRTKAVVFLVNVEQSMDRHLSRVQDHLSYMFEKGLEDRDHISLITFSKNCRRLFSLVEKEKNFVQLKNQITRLEAS